MEVLCTKHPDTRPPSASSLDTYTGQPLDIFPVDTTKDTVTETVGRLSGGAGSGGVNLLILQHWLLRFGAASGELRLTVEDFVEWLTNGRPPWAAYRALMSGRLIARG